MITKHYLDFAKEEVTLPGSTGGNVRWFIGKKDGALRYAMRRFEIKPGGHIVLHSHPEEHEMYVLSGKGEILESTSSKTIVTQGGRSLCFSTRGT